ncbi:MAG: 1-acyl-sn-glycerol-3-phosphate acyltransferase, partial [Candidatus Nomurabacteria bacterium]|nr:1-acyl-sn-glycerol-3-phosphate acyltransferase [Candidatus Nomurabacteria bacterium]
MTEDEARPAGDGFFKVVKTIILPIFRGLFRMKIDGADNVPAAGGVILAGNHRDFSDPVALLAATRRTVHFLAMKELFRGPGKWLFKHLGAIPVDRSKKHSNGGSLAVAKEKLLQGQAVGIFP